MPDGNVAWSFHAIHRGTVLYNALVGFCVPGLPHKSTRIQLLLRYYSRAAAFLSAILVLFILIDFPQYKDVTDFGVRASEFTVSSISTCASIYFIICEDEFAKLTSDFDQVTLLCINDPLPDFNILAQHQTNGNIEMKIASISLWSMTLIPFIFFLPTYIKSTGLLGLDGKKSFKGSPLWLPCDSSMSPCFDITFWISAIFASFGVVQKLLYELYFVILFNQMATYFEHLKYSCRNAILRNRNTELRPDNTQDIIIPATACHQRTERIQFISKHGLLSRNTSCEMDEGLTMIIDSKVVMDIYSDSIDDGVCTSLRQWTELHQHVLRLWSDLCRIHRRIFAVYLGHTICLLTGTLFIVTDSNLTGSDAAMAAGFGMYTIATLGVLCGIGDKASQQSLEVTDEAFGAPWYSASPQAKSTFLLMVTRARTPIAACSVFHCAKLSKETFVALCNLIISYYLALVNIKKKSF